ncbi:MAG: hypothetical protein GW928_12025 [Rhodoferax sp.]|nr:hypothetical protein [Rhodoferax sp.]OIP13584.1 MAG: hypothetical protein AUK50_13240 [Comamonadaceae bacterium CG2_30_57_122]
MTELAGRTCPVAYRYGAEALANCPVDSAETLYVVGGLYGNPQALDQIKTMVAAEVAPVTLVFNGDFNWFNTDDKDFQRVNQFVLQHDAMVGNVEFELNAPDNDAGCGCSYPVTVDEATVERSNRIHARLKATARCHPDILAKLAALPLFRRYTVGSKTIGVVHGDAESLAGWMFDAATMGEPENQVKISSLFARSRVDIFASSHTCLPVLRRFKLSAGRCGFVVNNGAAGMPNFRDQPSGLLTRISVHASPHSRLYGVELDGVLIDSLQIDYDCGLWQKNFLANWPVGSDAHHSYFSRIVVGADYTLAQAITTD